VSERIEVNGELFLGRVDEQNRFRALLDEMLKTRRRGLLRRRAPDPGGWSHVVLIYGEGGMGKSTLCKRLRDITQGQGSALDHPYRDKFRVLWLNWETRRESDLRLVARDAVSFETVLDHLYTTFREAGFGREFDGFEKERARRVQVQDRVERELSAQHPGPERAAPLRKLGAEGLARLIRTGLPAGALLPQQETVAALESIVQSGAEGLAHLRAVGEEWLRRRLKSDEYDLFVLPHETLARAFAQGVRAAARRKPLLIFLDTYEIADRVDPWLRLILRQAGPRAAWALSGRNNLAASRRYGQDYFTGYQGNAPTGRLRVFPMGEFSQADVAAYFGEIAPQRPLKGGQPAAALHRATYGIPLAVKEAAALWARGASLASIVEGIPARAGREEIVQKMTERFMVHALADREHPHDAPRLYALALAYRPDYDLLAALWEVDNVRPILDELERRYDFVFARKMRLHDAVRDFMREYLLAEVERKSPAVHQANARAARLLEERLAERQRRLNTLEARADDEAWVNDVLALAWHRFWLDEEAGWVTLLAAFPAGLAYDYDLAQALLDAAALFAPTWTNAARRRLKTLRANLTFPTPDDEQAALLDILRRAPALAPSPPASAPTLDAAPGPEAPRREYLIQLRQTLVSRFQEGELQTLCFDLDVDYEGLRGEGKEDKARELIKYLRDRQRIPELVDTGKRLRPDIAWDDAPPASKPTPSAPPPGPLQPDQGCAAEQAVIQAWLQGRLARGQGRHEQALEALTKATRRVPAETGALRRVLGQALNALSRDLLWPDNAPTSVPSEPGLQAARLETQMDPENQNAWYRLGAALYPLDRHEEASTAFHKAIELAPQEALPWNGLGNVYYVLSRYEEAIAAYHKAIELDPQYAAPWRGLGIVYRHQGRHEEVIAAYRKAIELAPQDAALWGSLGYLHLTLGNEAEADKALSQAVGLEPGLSTHLVNLGILRYRQGQTNDGRRLFREALTRCAGQRVLTRLEHAWLQVATGETEAGLAALRAMLTDVEPVPSLLAGFIRDTDLLAAAPEPPPGLAEMRRLLEESVNG
jgi:Flp pilus assembly protein TadD